MLDRPDNRLRVIAAGLVGAKGLRMLPSGSVGIVI